MLPLLFTMDIELAAAFLFSKDSISDCKSMVENRMSPLQAALDSRFKNHSGNMTGPHAAWVVPKGLLPPNITSWHVIFYCDQAVPIPAQPPFFHRTADAHEFIEGTYREDHAKYCISLASRDDICNYKKYALCKLSDGVHCHGLDCLRCRQWNYTYASLKKNRRNTFQSRLSSFFIHTYIPAFFALVTQQVIPGDCHQTVITFLRSALPIHCILKPNG